MKNLVEKLVIERKELNLRIDTINNAIEALKSVCSHKNPDGSDAFEDDGRDSHHDYYKCNICGETKKD